MILQAIYAPCTIDLRAVRVSPAKAIQVALGTLDAPDQLCDIRGKALFFPLEMIALLQFVLHSCSLVSCCGVIIFAFLGQRPPAPVGQYFALLGKGLHWQVVFKRFRSRFRSVVPRRPP